MPRTCPLCIADDLPDAATRCRHCGGALDAEREGTERLAFEARVRADLRDEVKAHRDYLAGLLGELRLVALGIVAIGAGALVFFGYQTSKGIDEVALRIGKASAEQIESAAARVAAEASAEVKAAVARSIVPAEEQAARVLVRTAELEQGIEALAPRLDAAGGRIGVIAAAFTATRDDPVATAIVPTEPAEADAKGGGGQLRALLERPEPVKAVALREGGYYEGPWLWLYLHRLRARPEFRLVLFLDDSGRLAAAVPAASLAAALDAANVPGLVPGFGDQTENVPGPDAVPRWQWLAETAIAGDIAALARIPGLIPASAAIAADSPSLAALERMDAAGTDLLPVVDAEGRFAGIAERARITSQLVRLLASQAGE